MQHQQCGLSSPWIAALEFNWPVFLRVRAITGFTQELFIQALSLGLQRKAGPLSSPHPIISGSANAPGFKGVGVTHTCMYIQHTQLSQLVQAQPCSWEINGVESQQAFARSWAPCPPYVEQLSGGILAPPPRKDVASRRLQGVESSDAHIKICPEGLSHPPNSLIKTGQKRRNRRGGDAVLRCDFRSSFYFRLPIHWFVQSSCNLLWSKQ